MVVRWLDSTALGLLGIAALTGCASSGASQYSEQTPASIAAALTLTDNYGSITLDAPAIQSSVGFGDFSKGMMTGGGDFGNAVSLHGQQDGQGVLTHWLVAEVRYTNLGAVYREYDRAGIEGVGALTVAPLRSDRTFSVYSVNMTETVRIDIAEADLRARAASGFILRLADDSNNIVEMELPASYVAGYLLRVDALGTASTAP